MTDKPVPTVIVTVVGEVDPDFAEGLIAAIAHFCGPQRVKEAIRLTAPAPRLVRYEVFRNWAQNVDGDIGRTRAWRAWRALFEFRDHALKFHCANDYCERPYGVCRCKSQGSHSETGWTYAANLAIQWAVTEQTLLGLTPQNMRLMSPQTRELVAKFVAHLRRS